MTQPISFSTQDIIDATNGDLLCCGQNSPFLSISIDSRVINREDLFVAIIGENHDGHTFIKDILDHGCRGLIIDKKYMQEFLSFKNKYKNITCVAVDNTTKALGRLASFQRIRSGVTVTAITGSSGKTTTRTLVSSVMEEKFSTLSTLGNYNNEIGLPLTLLRLEDNHEQAVVELGMNHAGEIKRLSEICQPDIGVITNIGPAHLEGVGSINGVMQAKAELLSEIKPGGTAILNADDHRVLKLSEMRKTKTLLYGFSDMATIRGVSLEPQETGTRFTILFPDTEITVSLKAAGNFFVSNALAAAAAGYIAGLEPKEIRDGIEKFQPIQGRMNIFQTTNGIHIIDDTYNANPDSVKAALTVLKSLRQAERGIFVFGDMFELGDHSETLHREVGAFAAESGITSLYVMGKFAEAVAKGAIEKKMNKKQIFTGAREDIILQLKKNLMSGDWLLIKGSRAMKMESILEGLKESMIKSR